MASTAAVMLEELEMSVRSAWICRQSGLRTLQDLKRISARDIDRIAVHPGPARELKAIRARNAKDFPENVVATYHRHVTRHELLSRRRSLVAQLEMVDALLNDKAKVA